MHVHDRSSRVRFVSTKHSIRSHSIIAVATKEKRGKETKKETNEMLLVEEVDAPTYAK